MRPNHPMPIRTGHTFLAYNPKMTSDQQTVNSEQRTVNNEQRTTSNEQRAMDGAWHIGYA